METSADGTYSIEVLDGTYDFGMEAWSDADSLPRMSACFQPGITVSGDGEHDFRLPYLRVSGRVVTSTGVPIAGAEVSSFAQGTSRDLIALLLGRDLEGEIRYSNDFARGFAAAFPGP